MKVQVEEISAVKRRVDVEVPAERVRSEYERAYQSISQKAQIKGFRRGRVPRPVLERYFADEVRSEVTTKLVREGFSSALEGSNLTIVAPPELDVTPSGETEPLRFSATFEVLPEIGGVDVSGLTAGRPRVVVSDEDVGRVLDQLRQRHAQLKPIEDRQDVARGDFATVDITVRKGDEVLADLSVKSATVEVAAGHLPAEVDDRLALARVGETFTAIAPAPGGASEESSGEMLAYEVTVTGIATRLLPDLDDEFAKDFGAGDTLQALQERIAADLQRDAQRRSDAVVREAVLDQMISRNPIELPPAMVSGRVDDLLNDFKAELASRGLQLRSAAHEDEAREKLQQRAERDVHARLLLDRVGAQLGIEVPEEELAERIGTILAAAGQHREHLREHYTDPHARDALRSDLRRTRTLEQLVSSADVTEVEPRVD